MVPVRLNRLLMQLVSADFTAETSDAPLRLWNAFGSQAAAVDIARPVRNR
jgi:hypothetical protein